MKIMKYCLQKLEKDKKYLKILFFVALMFSMTLTVLAQNTRTITGKLSDENGEPLIGATIKLKGAPIGIVTDIDGNYSISVPAGENNMLIVSYVGYLTKEVEVKNNNILNIILTPEPVALTETVVVGYGTQKKIHLTGSVAQISADQVIKAPMTNVSAAVVGKLPGIISSQNNGAPGSDGTTLMVRGYSSYVGSSTLVLVDGIERSMDRIDPNDIESITILKDAAASAIYGMKAGSGVILVTTKRGSAGNRPQISYHGSVSFAKQTKLPKFMNGTEYMEWYNKARNIAHTFDPSQPEGDKFTAEEIAMTTNGDPTDGYENTNWRSPLDRLSPTHQHNLSVSGSSQFVRYYVSGGFLDQRGFFRDFSFKRSNLRSNIDIDATKDITVSLNMAGRIEKSNRPGALSYNNQEYNNVVGVMMYALPFVPKQLDGYPTSGYRGGANPEYARDHSGYSKTERNVVETSAKIEYRIPHVKGLKASFLLAYDHMDIEGKSFSNTYEINQYDFGTKTYKVGLAPNLSEDGALYVNRDKRTRVQVRPAIEYANTFGKHNISGILLFERTETKNTTLSATRTDFIIFDRAELGQGASFPATNPNNGGSSSTAMAGIAGRLSYILDGRYLLEGSFRYDGSYRFAPGYRWGFFPSVSAGWVISEEPFFKGKFENIDKLKIKGSWGRTSNDNVDADLWNRLYSTQNMIPTVFGGNLYKTVAMNNIYLAEDLTWEKTDSYNLGLEFEFGNGLFGMDFDVFYKKTFDILQTFSGVFAPSIGGNYPKIKNDGKFSARGFEVQLRHRHKIVDFNYSLTGNLSLAKNKIISKYEQDGIMPWASVLGTPFGSIYGYKSLGIARTQEDIDKAAKPTSGTLGLGDIMYEDINGDGKIDSRDMTRIARSNMPEMMFSFNIDLNYKGFDLSALFSGAALVDKMLAGRWNNGATDSTPLTRPFYGNSDNSPLYLIEGSWRPDNPGGKYPRLSTVYNPNNSQLSDFWKENGTYLRLRSLTLGYTIPKEIVTKARLSNIRLYVAGTNLFTLTSFKYLDPEAPNVLQGYYPQQKTMSVGVNITF